MKRLLLVLLLTAATPALAQEPAPSYVPLDQDLWTQMSQAFTQLNMPLSAHQQVQQILQGVEREAQARARKNEAKPNAK